jgi:GNAT superfamily N-acetyltransferase
VRAWYDDLRERSGLERLPPEPEEEEDLVRSDFAIEEGGKAEALSRMLALLEGAEEEARAELPPALASFEAARLRDVLSREEWIGAWIDDGEGGAIAGAAARIEGDAGQSFIRLFFLHVVPDFRRSGIGEALVEQLSGGAGASRLMVIDAPFLPPGLAAPLAARGFLPWGLRLRRRL